MARDIYTSSCRIESRAPNIPQLDAFGCSYNNMIRHRGAWLCRSKQRNSVVRIFGRLVPAELKQWLAKKVKCVVHKQATLCCEILVAIIIVVLSLAIGRNLLANIR